MGERLKELRRASGMNQTQFAEFLGISRNYLALIEIGQKIPSDRIIRAICATLNIDEKWFRTGQGDMETVMTRQREFAAALGSSIDVENEEANYMARLAFILAELEEEDIELVVHLAERLARKTKKDGP